MRNALEYERQLAEMLIISPYFVPGNRGVDSLDAAVQRGVRVAVHTKAVVVDDRWVFVGSMNLAAQLHEEFRQSTSPDMRHSVVLDDRHGLVWRDRVEGRERTLHAEPDSTVGRRVTAYLMRLLPLESQL